MDASPFVGCRGRQGLQCRHRSDPPACPFELRLLPHPLIAVAQQRREFFRRARLHAFGQQPSGRGHLGIGGRLGEHRPVDPAFVALGPSLVPIGEEDRPVGAQVHIGHQRVPHQGIVGHQFIGGSGRPLLQRADAALGARALEIRQQETPPQGPRQAGAGVVDQTARAVANVGDGSQDRGRLAFESRHPQALEIPQPCIAQRCMLVTHPPARVGPLDHLHPALPVSLIRVVVAGEQIALVVEGQFLGIAQPAMHHLELRSVGLAAEHRALIGQVDHGALAGRHVRAAVTAGKIQTAVGAEDQPVQVVSRETEPHPEPMQDRLGAE